ncbi:MAG: MerR family DNA-binding transcriptional regulator [Defluviitaleaceae bacterium]|nr:MerR family DNA-binding transcriptional regulator [Defluviitaleaceae bacterium]
MSRRKNLMSIGDISKLTGSSIKSLRYYEKINILKPAYISSDSGYRYYSLDQAYLIGMIRFSIEIGIPLAQMTQFVDADGTMDFRSFIEEGRAVAEKKLGVLKRGLRHIDIIERSMDLAERHEIGEIYEREIPPKRLYVIPCGESLNEAERIKVLQKFMELPIEESDWEDAEHGVLCEQSPSGAEYFYFVELPEKINLPNEKIIPGGTFFCVKTEDSEIKRASEIFHIGGSFIAVETEIFTGLLKVNKPLCELRVIRRPHE